MSAEETPETILGVPEHEHHWEYAYTHNWRDGDSDDIYKCACGATEERYVPR